MPIYIAHRGVPQIIDENTLNSFNKAIELGADMIELDVHCLKDGTIMVIHDETLDRTTNAKGFIKDFSYHDLKDVFTSSGQPIPTLSQVIELVRGRVAINIELKGRGTAEPVKKLIDDYVTFQGFRYEDILVSSSDERLFQSFVDLKSQAPIGWISRHDIQANFFESRNWPIRSLHLSSESIDKEVIQKWHTKGVLVYSWTVNESALVEKFTNWNIDGIFSDVPGLVKRDQ